MVAEEAPAAPVVPLFPLALAAIVKSGGQDLAGGPSDASPDLAAPTDAQRFSARIRLLTERAGSAGALARSCGVTARTVRNWCSGYSDISRERCLVLARALRVSPLWLISGEGCMTDDAADCAPLAEAPARRACVDAELLASALQVLQSYIELAGGSLSPAQRAEAVVELYGMLAQPRPAEAAHLIAFHKRLASQLRGHRRAFNLCAPATHSG